MTYTVQYRTQHTNAVNYVAGALSKEQATRIVHELLWLGAVKDAWMEMEK